MSVKKEKFKHISLIGIALFFWLAGLNHFLDPGFYYPLIPPYLPWVEEINVLSGIFEMLLGLGLLSPRFRSISSYLIIVMLVAFIPSHIYFIQIGACVEGGLCTPMWLAWLRLVLIQPLLMLWAWWHRK